MIMILECHQGGDPRFAAEEARLASGQTIAQLYQGAKRDEAGQPYQHPQKVLSPASFSLWGEERLSCGDNHMRRHLLYLLLWHLYFQEHPHLLVEACRYDAFRSSPQVRCWYPSDIYPGLDDDHSIEHLRVYSGSTSEQIRSVVGTQRQECDPAAAVAYLVHCAREEMEPLFPGYLKRMERSYHQQFHPALSERSKETEGERQ
jgi:hypothetical protein